MYIIYIKFHNKGFYMCSIIIEIIYHKFKYSFSITLVWSPYVYPPLLKIRIFLSEVH